MRAAAVHLFRDGRDRGAKRLSVRKTCPSPVPCARPTRGRDTLARLIPKRSWERGKEVEGKGSLPEDFPYSSRVIRRCRLSEPFPWQGGWCDLSMGIKNRGYRYLGKKELVL